MRHHLLPFIALAFASGCTFDGATANIYCDGTEASPKGFECVDGVWVSETTGAPIESLDMRQLDPPDMRDDIISTPDMEQPPVVDMKPPVDATDMRQQAGPDMRPDGEPDMRIDEPDMRVDEPDMKTPPMPDMKPASDCGDGVLDPGEACDDSNMNAGDGCDADCQEEPGWDCSNGGCVTVCGDGVLIAPNEQCDDSNTATGDGCDASCQPEQGWVCPIGAAGACDEDCGDGALVGDERCDDGVNDGQQGCESDCTVTPGWVCTGAPSSCVQTTEGNGQLDPGEDCDDGNQVDADGCSLAGEIAPGYICGAPGTACGFVTGATASSTTTGYYPAAVGGAEFTLDCPAGTFVTGVDGHETMLNGLGKIKAVCHSFTTNPTTGRLEWGAINSTAYTGGQDGTDIGTTSCPTNSFATKFSVREDWSTQYGTYLVYGLKLECREFSIVDGDIERSHPPSATSRHGSKPQNSSKYSDDCGVIASGITGYSGASLDRFALRCSDMSLTF